MTELSDILQSPLRRALVSDSLFERLPESELAGLEWLLLIVQNSKKCSPAQEPITIARARTSSHRTTYAIKSGKMYVETIQPHGILRCQLDDEVEILLDVENTITNRLVTSHRFENEDISIPHSKNIVASARNPRFGFTRAACVVGLDSANTPASDDCVSIVLLADSGFKSNVPYTLKEAIIFAMSPRHYPANRRKLRQERIQERIDALRRERDEIEDERRLADEFVHHRIRIDRFGWKELLIEHKNARQPETQIDKMVDDYRESIILGIESVIPFS